MTRRDMSAADRVATYLRENQSLEFCDACLGREVGLAVELAREARLALRTHPDFEQFFGRCSGYQHDRLIIGYPPR